MTSVSVTWRKPTGLDQVSYLLTLLKDGESLQTVPTDSLEYKFSDLQTDTEYTISVCTTLVSGHQSKAIFCHINTGNRFQSEHITIKEKYKYFCYVKVRGDNQKHGRFI